MNERIKLLAGQAKFMAEEELNRQISYNAELKAFAEKFAELIVLDVLDEVLKAIDDGMDVYDTVTEHFGVEE